MPVQTLADYVNDVQEILHDSTASVWPISRVISRINDARIDAARDMHCVRQNVTGIQLVQGQEIYNLNGAIAGANVIAGGSNYGTGSTVPVTFAAPPAGGVQALGFGNIIGGSLSSITITRWGSGYVSIPTITIGGVGSGAVATPVALFQSNPLSTIIGLPIAPNKISYIWNGERRTMKYASFLLFDAYARMWVQNFLAPPGIWTQHPQQQQVYIQPPPDQQYISEWDIIFLPSPLIAMSDPETQIIEPWTRPVQFKASAYLLQKLRNPGIVNDMNREYMQFMPHVITTSQKIAVPNIYNRNFQRRIMR